MSLLAASASRVELGIGLCSQKDQLISKSLSSNLEIFDANTIRAPRAPFPLSDPKTFIAGYLAAVKPDKPSQRPRHVSDLSSPVAQTASSLETGKLMNPRPGCP